ncbi:hypothetical protein J4459_03110 [Candidatus Woesearchaeota archaeon]|nr:hypothetical protein [Candidatus Woesearchaeota archaeon]
MFFAENEEKEFPEEIRKEINNLESKDREIYELNKKNKNIDIKVIHFVINALNLFLKYNDKLDKKQKNLMTEAIGNIPITFFILDKLKTNKRIKEVVNPLVDIVDSHSNLHIDREKLILEVLKDLRNLQKSIEKA